MDEVKVLAGLAWLAGGVFLLPGFPRGVRNVALWIIFAFGAIVALGAILIGMVS